MSAGPKAVLITGCSTGIGRACAIELARRGWAVHASARRLEDIGDLAEHGCACHRLDVCDEPSMAATIAAVEDAHGALDALVNNAGYGLEAPVEELDVADVRRLFETIVFGPLRLTQLALPGMRRRGAGRIVNMSSVAGRIVLPGGGAYHASKWALEALTDALRFEVRGFGVQVVIIEPGAIPTRWTEKAIASLHAADATSPYAELRRVTVERLEGAHRGMLGRLAGSAQQVARVTARALESPRPKSRYVVPRSSAGFIAMRRFLPDRAWDAFCRRVYPSPGHAGSS